MADGNLPQTFYKAQHLYFEISEGTIAGNDPEFLPVLEEALKQFSLCAEMMDSLALFSSNEIEEDITTNNLKFILVPYYMGDLTGKLLGDRRQEHLEKAKVILTEFIDTCERFQLLKPEFKRVLQRPPNVDPATKRQDKIDQFKREKMLKEKIKTLSERRKLRETGHVGGGDDAGTDEEEEDREFWLAMIDDALNNCTNLFGLMDQEMEILRMRPPPSKEPQLGTVTTASGLVIPPCAHGHAHGSKGLMKVRLDKESIRDAVFQMSNQPTMSIEEFGKLQEKHTREREKRQAEAQKLQQQAVALLGLDVAGSAEQEDAQTLKDRKWSDWKDEHPKGAGNTQRY